jgi:predicted double-glycine peptidase
MALFLAAVLLAAASGCRAMWGPMSRSAPDDAQTADRRSGEVFQSVGNGFQVRQPVVSWKRKLRENVVTQQLDYSCGSAALATLVRYYFRDELTEQDVLRVIFQRLAQAQDPRAELKDRIENGFSMLDLLNAAKDLGYLAAAVRIPIAKLQESQAPVIVRIEKYGFKHFVVLRGVHDHTVYLADPIRGNIRLSIQEFLAEWSGESLFLGKPGFGLPQHHPLALTVEGPARPELEVARQALFPAP